ncbi:MAG: hypothetical protein GF333_07780 [Candidatus Omnitrophica bacterium]|nr:hypothetical protein [Candidatus Omnitrophota bacterium]
MKYVLNLVALAVIGLVIFGVMRFKKSDAYYTYRQKLDDITSEGSEYLEVKKHNIKMDYGPGRDRPITFVKRETLLREYLPMVFGHFSDEEWKNFWEIVYKPVPKKKGDYRVKQYRSHSEIESILRRAYPNPFTYLKPEHWKVFWKIVEGEYD